MIVYNLDGKRINLGNEINRGGEGIIYEMSDPQLVAKIYLPEKRNRDKFQKIKLIVDCGFRCDGICFPQTILKNADNELVGFAMPRVRGKAVSLQTLCNPMRLANEYSNWTKKGLVELCMNILRKINYLHKRDMLFGDVNLNNILVASPSEVYFVDTDSYQIGNYLCPVGTEEFTAPEILGKNYKTFARSVSHENYAVAVLLFEIMMYGKHPYGSRNLEFREAMRREAFPYPRSGSSDYSAVPEGVWGKVWSYLSDPVRDAFYETFQHGARHNAPSARFSSSDWMNIFNQYLSQIQKLCSQDGQYGAIFPTSVRKGNASETAQKTQPKQQQIQKKQQSQQKQQPQQKQQAFPKVKQSAVEWRQKKITYFQNRLESIHERASKKAGEILSGFFQSFKLKKIQGAIDDIFQEIRSEISTCSNSDLSEMDDDLDDLVDEIRDWEDEEDIEDFIDDYDFD